MARKIKGRKKSFFYFEYIKIYNSLNSCFMYENGTMCMSDFATDLVSGINRQTC